LIIDYIKRLKLIYKTCNFKLVSLLYFSIILALVVSIFEAFFIGLVYSVISMFLEGGTKLSHTSFPLNSYFNDNELFQNFLLLMMICIIFFVTILKIINLKISTYLYSYINTLVSSHIFNKTLFSNFNFHQKENSASLVAIIAQKSKSVGEITFFLLGIVKSAIMLISITAVAIFLSSKSFLLYFFLILIIFLSLYKIIKSKLKRLGVIVADENVKIIQSLQESYSNIPIIIVHNMEKFFYDKLKKSIFNLRKSEGNIVFTSGVPYILVNFFFIGSFLVLIYFFKDSSFSYLPIMATWLLAMQKLFPSFNEIFSNMGTIKSLKANFNDTENLIFNDLKEERIVHTKENIEFNNQITFKNISFKHEESKDFILENINLTIKKNSTTGIVGKTGVGKSSLINLIIGFLSPTVGLVMSDSSEINHKNIFNWQKKISIVPQNIMLLDDTIENNIVFNNTKNKKKLDFCIRVACLEELVNEFSQKENNLIGENGKRISGGQRQRVGIARAIYRDTNILILDEAFNSLDNKTKNIILNNLKALKKTIITITHDKTENLSYDTVLLIENKQIRKIN
jgi:ATP-binding cassette, subfamily B, bacterial PglK